MDRIISAALKGINETNTISEKTNGSGYLKLLNANSNIGTKNMSEDETVMI